MLRWTPPTPGPSPQKWQSRAEILKSALAADFNSGLRRLQAEWEAVKREYYARKFDPNQPRVPAGNADGGQWTSDGANLTVNEPAALTRQPAAYLLAAGGKQSAAYCWNQMLIDFLLCDSLGPRSLIGACRSQAMERYAACLQGKRIPPLPF